MILLIYRNKQRRKEQMKSANRNWKQLGPEQQDNILKYQDNARVVYNGGVDDETVVTKMTANRVWIFDLKTGEQLPFVSKRDNAIDWDATKANYDSLNVF
jgi:hypothetical protein